MRNDAWLLLYRRRTDGSSVARIVLSENTIAEDASANDVVGILSVANGSGTYTFTITADPDSKFQIANDDELQLADTLDYETATSHSVTIEADNGVDDPISRVFTINVTNVLEVTLNALTLDVDEIEEGYSPGATVGTLQDVTSGSTLSLIDDDGGRFALDGEDVITTGVTAGVGTYSITVRETHPDATAVDSIIAIDVTEMVDVGAPTVSSFNPADNATSVSVSATSLIITFSEPIQIGATASLRLYKTSGDVLVQEWTEADTLVLFVDGDELEMVLDDPLEPGVDYYVQIDAGSVEDLADNAYAGIANETTWNFTTAAAVPSAFVTGDWAIAAGDEEADVTINSLPAANGASITDIEYRLDGGSWVSSGGTSSFTITSLTNDQEYDVELRAVNSVGNGAAGDTKQVTPEAVGGFDPATLSPYLWHEPAYLASQWENDAASDAAEVSDGIAVSHDRSGNSRHGSQTSATQRPTLGNSGALYWHEYDGSNDYLTLASSLGLLRNRAGFTVVAGVRIVDTGANVKTALSVPSGAGNGRFGLQTDSGGGTSIDAVFRRLDADGATVISRNFTDGADYVVTIHCDYAGTGQVSLSLNRGTPATATLPSAAGNSSDTNSSAAPSMGGFGSTSTNPYRSRIYAMFVCPLLGAGDTADLEDYVAALSGVTL